jgi:hypothetical protein
MEKRHQQLSDTWQNKPRESAMTLAEAVVDERGSLWESNILGRSSELFTAPRPPFKRRDASRSLPADFSIGPKARKQIVMRIIRAICLSKQSNPISSQSASNLFMVFDSNVRRCTKVLDNVKNTIATITSNQAPNLS